MSVRPTIVCGCSQATREQDLERLFELGVGELYAGYLPERWLQTLGSEVSPNRRYQADRQLRDRQQLVDFAARARRRGVDFLLALNEQVWPSRALELLPELVDDALSAGVAGFIVAEPVLLAELSRLAPGLQLAVSNEAACLNGEAAKGFRALGATRIIFPRELTLGDMAQIIQASQDQGLQYEAFAAREYCLNASSFCLVSHGYGQSAHFCCSSRGRELLTLPGEQRTPLTCPTPALDARGLEAMGVLNRCGFCALPELKRMGVTHLKLPGRSSSALRALAWLRELLSEGVPSPARSRAFIDSPSFCDSGRNCYYRVRSGSSPRSEPLSLQPPASVSPPSSPPLASTPPRGGARLVRALRALQLAPSGRVDLDPACVENLPHPAPPASGPTPAAGQPCSSPRPLPRVAMATSASSARSKQNTPAPCLYRSWGDLQRLGVPAGPSWPEPEGAELELRAWSATVHELQARGWWQAAPVRLYLGLELCGLGLPSPVQLRRALDALNAAGLPCTLVLPPVWGDQWARIEELVERALRDPPPGLELRLNDLGLAWHLARRGAGGVAIGLGRLLERSKRHVFPESSGFAPQGDAPERLWREQRRALAELPLAAPRWEPLLRSLGVLSLGADLLPTPRGELACGELPLELYLPWTFLSLTRVCPVAGHLDQTSPTQPTERCSQGCRSTLVLHDYPWSERAIVQRGLGTFADLSAELGTQLDGLRSPPARLVLESRVPC